MNWTETTGSYHSAVISLFSQIFVYSQYFAASSLGVKISLGTIKTLHYLKDRSGKSAASQQTISP